MVVVLPVSGVALDFRVGHVASFSIEEWAIVLEVSLLLAVVALPIGTRIRVMAGSEAREAHPHIRFNFAVALDVARLSTVPAICHLRFTVGLLVTFLSAREARDLLAFAVLRVVPKTATDPAFLLSAPLVSVSTVLGACLAVVSKASAFEAANRLFSPSFWSSSLGIGWWTVVLSRDGMVGCD